MNTTTNKRGKAAQPLKLYFAYGANTCLASMRTRCPDATPVCAMKLDGHRLVFRGVADVVEAQGRAVFGAVWRITPACEASLDRFEGYPSMYEKQHGRMTLDGQQVDVFWYVMNGRDYEATPPAAYEATLRRGYADFNLPAEQIDLAVLEAEDWHAEHGNRKADWWAPAQATRAGSQWRKASR